MQENNKKDTEQCTLHGVIMSFVGGVGIEQIDVVGYWEVGCVALWWTPYTLSLRYQIF